MVKRVGRLLEVGRRLAMLVTSGPLVQCKSVSQEHVLLDLSPAHADARVTACAPAHDYKGTKLAAISDQGLVLTLTTICFLLEFLATLLPALGLPLHGVGVQLLAVVNVASVITGEAA
jgi:hypothetical protein